MSRAARLVAVLVLVAACDPSPASGPATVPPSSAPASVGPAGTSTVAPTATDPAYPSVVPGAVGEWRPEVVARIPHDPQAFTQGLVVDGDVVWESTGLYGQSTLRRTDRLTGEVLDSARLRPDQFGEGLELAGDRLLQLTWQEETALIWDPVTVQRVGRHRYRGEGWGLCAPDADRLVMSDGTSTLTIRDPVTFAVTGRVAVSRHGEPVDGLNELECVDGLVFANVYPSDEIVVIASDGSVVAVIDASALDAELADVPGRDVLNGIAHDPATGTFLLAGKRWPTTFEVRFVER